MPLWSWLKAAFAAPPETAPGPDVDAQPEIAPDEAFLRDLLARVSEPSDAPPAVGDREFWAAVTRMLSSGRERTALELLGRFAAARPDDHAVTARLAELLCERLEHATARPLLERLTAVPGHALRAHFLLADAAERSGDPRGARRHLEAILAVDLDYPQARARADRLPKAAAEASLPAPAASPTLSGLPEGGTGFAGRYRLLRELGRGAAGAVYVAHDAELDRDLALKILHPHARARAELDRARAWLEARVAAAIRHPGVIAIYDLDEERQLIAMELCTGGALDARLRAGPLPAGEALARAEEIFATLAAVHARGIVHGDVKPANLLHRVPAGELVLGDFGLAQLLASSDEAERAPRGTLAYMAPEQRRGELSCAADVYAAGVILVELLSGSAALAGWLGDRAALLRGEARWSGSLPPEVAATLGAEVAARLTDLCRALLAAHATARPSAETALAALQELARARGTANAPPLR
jgi:serine/threonine-protein kinase